MNGNKSVAGTGVLDVLQIIFIVLKLTGLIDWSWWAVFAPLFISLGLVAIIVILTTIARKVDE